MKRSLFGFIALFVLLGQLNAAPISKEQARKKAAAFMAAKGLTNNEMKLVKAAPRKSKASIQTDAAYYVFNATQDNGFVIISGEDQTEAVLGYADKGTFDEVTMPSNVKAWLDSYAEQIELVSNGKAEPAKAPAERKAVEPLIQTRWNQDKPYNQYCPAVNDTICPTGCVATAIAQIMYYHKWPQEITTTIPAYTSASRNIYMKELPPTTFDWDAMPIDESSGEANEAVAKLMQYVGQAVQMSYDTAERGGSGANSFVAYCGLKNYLGYSESAKMHFRLVVSFQEWHDIVYKDLSEGRPVYYAGSSSGEGHAFVCDGYDGNGLYHINWGWNGAYNGFFRLEVLNPHGAGIGASSTEGGYSDSQFCITGLQRPTGIPTQEEHYLSSPNVGVEGTIVGCELMNMFSETIVYDLAWAFMDDNGNIGNIITNINGIPFAKSQSTTYQFDTNELVVDDGTYKIVPVSKESSTSTWKSMVPSYSYLELIVSNGKKTLISHPIVKLKIDNFQWPEIVSQYMPTSVTFDVENLGDEFNGSFYLFIPQDDVDDDEEEEEVKTAYYNDYNIANDNMGEEDESEGEDEEEEGTNAINQEGVYIEKGGRDQITMHLTFAGSGTFNIMIATDEKGEEVVAMSSIEVLASPEQQENLEMISMTCEQSNDKAIVTVKIKNNSEEHYANNIVIQELSTEISDNDFKDVGQHSYSIAIAPGKTTELQHVINDLKEGYKYITRLWISKNLEQGQYEPLGTSNELAVIPTGINDATNNTMLNDAPYYTISGIKVDKPVKKGIYIHNGKKVVY